MSRAPSTLERLRSGELAGVRRLDLSDALTEVPAEVLALADSLEVLNLSGNRLQTLPSWLSRMRRLKVVFCSDNPFTELPEVLGECPALEMVGFKSCRVRHVPATALPQALRWLILTDNAVEGLPQALGERPALQKLMLAGNRLAQLPDSLAQAQRLELLRLSANRLTELPAWVLALPRRSWLACAGNSLGWACPLSAPLPAVDWRRLQVHERLGEGASGQIHRVQAQGDAQPLALKLFKGAITSDGRPEDELAASLVVGAHPALCTPVATLGGHPEGRQGTLLPLMPAGLRLLAQPPSLQSCTRDVYPSDWTIPLAQAQALAATLADALAHLHRRGVLHGDFYAHNIHWDPQTGAVMLGDFGAASLLPAGDAVLARGLCALDVRAYGCLLQELVDHVPVIERTQGGWLALRGLAEVCLDEQPGRRPTMQALAAALC